MLKRFSIAVLLCFCTTVNAGGWEKLDAAAAKELFSDLTTTHKDFVIYYAVDGTQKGAWGVGKYTGTFRINDEGHVCAKWDDFKESHKKEGCWSYQVKKKKMKANPESGRANESYSGIKFKEGNTKKL